MAGVLDAARMRCFIAVELGVSVENVDAFVLGGHGDTMVPLPRYCHGRRHPAAELLRRAHRGDRQAHPQRRRRDRQLLKTGSAYYAPAASVVEMVAAILHDKKKILPCAACSRASTASTACSWACP